MRYIHIYSGFGSLIEPTESNSNKHLLSRASNSLRLAQFICSPRDVYPDIHGNPVSLVAHSQNIYSKFGSLIEPNIVKFRFGSFSARQNRTRTSICRVESQTVHDWFNLFAVLGMSTLTFKVIRCPWPLIVRAN